MKAPHEGAPIDINQPSSYGDFRTGRTRRGR